MEDHCSVGLFFQRNRRGPAARNGRLNSTAVINLIRVLRLSTGATPVRCRVRTARRSRTMRDVHSGGCDKQEIGTGSTETSAESSARSDEYGCSELVSPVSRVT